MTYKCSASIAKNQNKEKKNLILKTIIDDLRCFFLRFTLFKVHVCVVVVVDVIVLKDKQKTSELPC